MKISPIYRFYLKVRVAQWYNPMDLFLSAQVGKYIHVEIFDKKTGLSFSSRGRVKNVKPRRKGVYWSEVDYNKGNWISIPLRRINDVEKFLFVMSLRTKRNDSILPWYVMMQSLFQSFPHSL